MTANMSNSTAVLAKAVLTKLRILSQVSGFSVLEFANNNNYVY